MVPQNMYTQQFRCDTWEVGPMVGPYSRVLHKLFTYTSAVGVLFALAALASCTHAHMHT